MLLKREQDQTFNCQFLISPIRKGINVAFIRKCADRAQLKPGDFRKGTASFKVRTLHESRVSERQK